MNFQNISAWSIRNPVIPLVFFVAITFAGILSFYNMDVVNNPDIEFPAVNVSISQPGAAPTEIENQITQRVESAVRSINGVKNLNSSAREGSSNTFIEFEIGTDPNDAVAEVKNAVDTIRGSLPDGILEPRVSKEEIAGGFLGIYAVEADDMTIEQLSWFIDDSIAKRLLSIEGMAEAGRFGGVNREIEVILDPAKMQALGVTASQINQLLRVDNLDAAGGMTEVGGTRQSVRVLGNTDSAFDLSQKQIRLGAGRTVKLSDVATVRDGYSERTSISKVRDKEVVNFFMSRAKGASDVTTFDQAKEIIAEIEAENEGVTFIPLFNTVKYTEEQYSSSMAAMVEGALLAVVVVFFFLRDWRATIISAVAIPLSAIPTFWFMDLLGFNLNQLSLLALGLVAGVLVDDAIVEIENIVRHMRMGKSAYQASIDAADEIGLPVVATSFCIVAVFLPVGLMPGISGQFFKNFGITVVIAVLMSLAVARMITPMLAAYFLKAKGHANHGEGPWMDRYMRVLRWSLDRSGMHRIRDGLNLEERTGFFLITLIILGVCAVLALLVGGVLAVLGGGVEVLIPFVAVAAGILVLSLLFLLLRIVASDRFFYIVSAFLTLLILMIVPGALVFITHGALSEIGVPDVLATAVTDDKASTLWLLIDRPLEILQFALVFGLGFLSVLAVLGFFGLLTRMFGRVAGQSWQYLRARFHDHRVWMVGIGYFSLLFTVLLFGLVPAQFQPTTDSDNSQITIEMVPGTTLAATERVSRQVADILYEQPEVERALERVREGDVRIYITLSDDREKTSVEFERDLAPQLATIPDARIRFQSQSGGFGSGRDLTVMLAGSDPELLESTAATLVEQMKGIDDLVAPRINADMNRPELIITPRPDLAAELGVTTAALSQTIRIATMGEIEQNAARFSLSDRQIPIRVKLPTDSRSDLNTIANLPVQTANGGSVPLERVAEISFGSGPTVIQRYNQNRRILVGADFAQGVVAGTAQAQVDELPVLQDLPQGVIRDAVGDQAWQQELQDSLFVAIIAGFLLVFAVLVLLYKRLMSPLVNMTSLLLAPLGGIFLIWIVGQAQSMPVYIGILLLLGIVSKNSILLIDFAIEAMAAGEEKLSAIIDAGHKRAQPIVMTTVAMTAGMVPIAFSGLLGSGDGAWRAPMGTMVIGGLIMSTVLTLLIVPAGFSLADGIEKRMGPWMRQRFLTYRPGDEGKGADPAPETVPAE
ncbi:efflux RND transporter permease subunit [Pontixanthobacter aestiaquae]|uniref:MMPL family transporter n=1 Tax=Pontixanthobacter aestiaquae TaxID=1509367 RepID=A0A844Z5G9_9SPHN|nr:efflux RND transporter permease subunit [Pontixanthobacter aestiaquae]MDN3646976.1 efflux RND transporter permease subunit [Pontixanthobacter aestiaquae]MXO82043.1 MMPL family transporter [Pontixanthobacter aestiaquae]